MQMHKRTRVPGEQWQTWTRQEGQALTIVIAAFALVLLVLSAALTVTQYSGKTIARQLSYQGQALNAAKAGVTDSLSWFRRQGTVVTVFNPRLDLTANPKINDSEEPTLGIQRSFEMSDTFGLTGRYRAPKQYNDAVTGLPVGVRDVTVEKGKSGAGTVWQLESKGCVIFGTFATTYGCDTTATPTPGRIIAKETVRAEIQRLNLILPAGGAAIYARRGDGVRINTGSRVQGGAGIGAAYPVSTGGWGGGGLVTGSTTVALDSDVPPKMGLQDIFGVTAQEVLSMADQNVASVAELPSTGLPQMNLIVIRGNATFGASYPLIGSGILIVFGDLTIPANTNASFSGVIYVTGNFTMAQPSLISGAIIAAGVGTPASGTGGAVTLNSSGDVAEVDFDQSIVDQIQAQMGNYRFSRSMYIVGKEAN